MVYTRTRQQTTSRTPVSCPVKPISSGLCPCTYTWLKVAVKWYCIGWRESASSHSRGEGNIINGYVSLVVGSTYSFKNNLDKTKSHQRSHIIATWTAQFIIQHSSQLSPLKTRKGLGTNPKLTENHSNWTKWFPRWKDTSKLVVLASLVEKPPENICI